MLTDKTEKIPAVAISPVEHGRNTEFSVNFQGVRFTHVNFSTFSNIF
jgi:hypothetical protein